MRARLNLLLKGMSAAAPAQPPRFPLEFELALPVDLLTLGISATVQLRNQ